MDGTYETLTEEEIDLSTLTPGEKTWLGRVVKAYEAGEAYPRFVNRVNAPGSPVLAGGAWVTKKVSKSPLYRLCQDLADRLGIAQGFLAVGKTALAERPGFAEPAVPSYLSCEEAAERVGVTSEAIRKAIREKRLPARRVGRTYLLDPLAVAAYAARSGREVRDSSSGNGKQEALEDSKRAKRRRARRP